MNKIDKFLSYKNAVRIDKSRLFYIVYETESFLIISQTRTEGEGELN